MDDDDVDAYNVSQSAYGSSEHHGKLVKRGYKKDVDLSDDRHSIYSKDGKVVIGYRGTNVKDSRDLKADLSLAFGSQHKDKSFKDAEDVYKKVKAKYSDKDIVLSGHSLGGTKSIHVAKKYGIKKSFAFNPGTGVFGTSGHDTIVYNTKGDPISSRIKSRNVKFISSNNINQHSLSNYEDHFNGKVRKKTNIWARQNIKY